VRKVSAYTCGLIIFTFILAIYTCGYRYNRNISSNAIYQLISADRWIQNGSKITFSGLTPYINSVEFTFDSWRPSGIDPAHLVITNQDQLIGEFLVTKDIKPIRFRMPITPEFDFSVKNPFLPQPPDQRKLGSKIGKTKVFSPIIVPIVAWWQIIIFGTVLLGAGILSFLLSIDFPKLQKILPFLAVLLVSHFFAHSNNDDLPNLITLYLIYLLFSVGVVFTRIHRRGGFGRLHNGKDRNLILSLLFIVLLIGGYLRFGGINFGLPGRFHPDETPKVNAIERMKTNHNLNPQYFLHPSLLLYSAYGTSKVLTHLGLQNYQWRQHVTYSGRLVSATAGTLSLIVVYLIGSILFSPFVGLNSSLLLATFPLHVTSSRYMKEDALMVFFFLCVVYIIVIAAKKNKSYLLLIGGIFSGLAFGTKYTGLLTSAPLFFTPILASCWTNKSSNKVLIKRYIIYIILALLLVPLIFILTTPYSILEPHAFLKGVQSEQKHMLRGHSVAIDAWSQYWMFHTLRSLLPGTTLIPLIFAIIGSGVLLARKDKRGYFVIGLFLLFYLPAEWVKAKPAPQPERYMMPCLPFIALIASEMVRVLSNTRVRRYTPLVMLFLVFTPLYISFKLLTEVVDDTRVRVGKWIEQKLPINSNVLVDWIPYAPLVQDQSYQINMFKPGRLLADLQEFVTTGQAPADYLVLSSLVYDRYFMQPDVDQGKRTVIRNAFKKLCIVHQEFPDTWSYGFHNPTLTIFKLNNLKKYDKECLPLNKNEMWHSSNYYYLWQSIGLS
jgi:hypothetical protein